MVRMSKLMCRDPKNIFNPTQLRLLSFTLNDYPGSIPDLNGCDADGKQAKETILTFWPQYDVRRYRENQFTIENFRLAVNRSIKSLSPGAVVVVFADCCFSGGLSSRTTGLAGGFVRNRFYAQPGIEIKPTMKTFLTESGLTWIVMSGCGPTQYCADAWVNNGWHGIYSWNAFRTLSPGMTYLEWHNEIRKYLPGGEYDQIPVIEGPMSLLNKRISEDQTLIIHNSSHGTQLQKNGKIYEAICMYNYNLPDYEYISMLQNMVA